MDLIMLVLVIAGIGFVVWMISVNVPMNPMFKTLIYVAVVIVMVLWLMRQFGQTLPDVMP